MGRVGEAVTPTLRTCRLLFDRARPEQRTKGRCRAGLLLSIEAIVHLPAA